MTEINIWRTNAVYMSPSSNTSGSENKTSIGMGGSNDVHVSKNNAQFGLQKSGHLRHLPSNYSQNKKANNRPEILANKKKGEGSKQDENPARIKSSEEENAMKLFTNSLMNIRKSHMSLNSANSEQEDIDKYTNIEVSPNSSLSSVTLVENDRLKGSPESNQSFTNYYSVDNGSSRFPYYDPLDIGARKHVVISNSPHSSCGSKTSISPHKSPVRGILKKKSASNSVSTLSLSSNEAMEHTHLSKSEGNLARSLESSPINRPQSNQSDKTYSRIEPKNELFRNRDGKSAFVSVKPRNTIQNNKVEGPLISLQSNNKHVNQEQTIQMQVTPRVTGSQPFTIPPLMQYTSIKKQLLQPNDLKTVTEKISGPIKTVQVDVHPRENQIQRNLKEMSPRNKNIKTSKSPNKSISCSTTEIDQVSITKNERLPSSETISNEATRIRCLINETSPIDLKDSLMKKLDLKDPHIINALSQVFPATKFTSKAHCVRCHKDYNPLEKGRCNLSHPERMVAKVGQDAVGADFVCGCCNVGFRLIKMDFYEESTNALLTGHCYSGLHTSDPDSVDYRIHGGAAKTCQENGCVEFYV